MPEPEGVVAEGAVAREAGAAEAVVPRRPEGVEAAAVGEEAVVVAGAPVSAGAAGEAAPAR
ncbi:hypothetical protein ACFWM7_03570 [Streptomyces sp. NPDC058375]|uniref:hypothetical protein n=1 Tax=Streptomyces sp. NPDC058375 TaxID=3346467 RepID=UPI00366A5178